MSRALLRVREIVHEPYDARPPQLRTVAKAIAADPDALEELEDEIATLSAHIEAASHRLLMLIAEYDRLRGWELAGYASCADWLAARTQIDLGTAREKVRTARSLLELPLTSAAMSRGELTFSQARALSRCADSSNEAALLELARGTTTAQLERLVRAYRKGSRQDDAAHERERYAARTLSVFPDDDGMYVIRGRLLPEAAALLMRALEAASDALYREAGPPWPTADPPRAAAQRRADAIALLAERALAAGFGAAEPAADSEHEFVGDVEAKDSLGCACGCNEEFVADIAATDPRNRAVENRETVAKTADHMDEEATPRAHPTVGERVRREAPISGTRAERYQVVLHVDMETLSEDGEPGRSELEDGTRVSCETSRRLACDASVVRVVHDGKGAVLDVGRRTRTIPPALRRALEVRDRGCRFPGCGKRFTDAHHVQHWSQGGSTSLSNCLLLCGCHHRLVHEGGWRVAWWGEGRPVFEDPRGGVHHEGGWQPPPLDAGPADTLLEQNRRHGAEPNAASLGARWKRESEIPANVHFRATESL